MHRQFADKLWDNLQTGLLFRRNERCVSLKTNKLLRDRIACKERRSVWVAPSQCFCHPSLNHNGGPSIVIYSAIQMLQWKMNIKSNKFRQAEKDRENAKLIRSLNDILSFYVPTYVFLIIIQFRIEFYVNRILTLSRSNLRTLWKNKCAIKLRRKNSIFDMYWHSHQIYLKDNF